MSADAHGKPLPLPAERLRELAEEFGTPLFVYLADTVRERLAELQGFDVVRYAQKANPNLHLLRLLHEGGAHVDAVSAGEVQRALEAGFEPSEIVFTADLFDRASLAVVGEHPIGVNVGTLDMLPELARVRPGAQVIVRVNPGFGHGHHPKVTTGGANSKHGVWHADIAPGIERARTLGLEVVGLHVHTGSGSDLENLARSTTVLAECARAVGPSLRVLSAGGGLPVPYRAVEPRFDVASHFAAWDALRSSVAEAVGHPIELEVEPGRYLVAEAGLLVCEVRANKRQGELDYVLVDAGFHNLVRPAMYGAYHAVTGVPLQANHGALRPQVVAGPLCESADVFTQRPGGELDPRPLPELAPGDLLCIHDAGAYGASMGSHYNSQPTAAEVLIEGDEARLIRRRQRLDELTALELDVPG